MDNNLLCPSCRFKVQEDWFFCPNCSKTLKEKTPEITFSKQILIYFVSFFLAPLGLGWGLKYVRSPDKKVRTIGIISIVLTVLSIILISMVFKGFIDQYSKILNNLVPSY
ncbi:MAG: zinc ribbon domain-containing protein [Patescibacteria group bacterium]|jgi:hypothetical protein